MSRLRSFGERVAASRVGSWLFLKVFTRVDRLLLRATRGYLSVSVGYPVVLLESVGARSGEQRATPLMCLPLEEDIVLIASNAGKDRSPAWYFNLRKNPQATCTLWGQKRRMVAREANGAEREALWERAVAFYSGYETYQARTGREIPIVVLSPAD